MEAFLFSRIFRPEAILLTLFVFLIGFAVPSNAKTYYVNNADSTASDSNPGTFERPWLTIHKANRTVTPGDTVIIMAGTYHDWIFPDACGDSNHWIVYKSEPEHQAILDGRVELNEVIAQGAEWIQDSTYGGNVWKIKLISNAFCEAWQDSSRMPFPFPYPCDTLEFAAGRSFIDADRYLFVWLLDTMDSPGLHKWQVTLKSGVWLLGDIGPMDKYLIVDGFRIENYGLAGVSVGKNYVKILNNKIAFNGRAGVEVGFCNHVVVDGNEAHHNCTGIGFSQGFTAYGVTGHDIYFTRNISHDNYDGADPEHCGSDGSGFILDTSKPEGGAIFINNVAYNNQGSGFGVYQSNYGYFINNTSFNNGLKNWFIAECHIIGTGKGSSNNLIFRNNIFAGRPHQTSVMDIKYPYSNPPVNVLLDHNLYYQLGADSTDALFSITVKSSQGEVSQSFDLEAFQNFSFPSDTGDIPLAWGENSMVASPELIDWQSGGFKLHSNSPAIDAGDSVHAPPTDFYNTPRPQGKGYDIGAYEYHEETGLEGSNIPLMPHFYVYPNPFNGQIRIQYALRQRSRVSLVIFDLLGRKVVTLLDKEIGPGTHIAIWKGKNFNRSPVASGIYIILFKTNLSSLSQKIVYLK